MSKLFGGDDVRHPGYEEMKDTPWITQGREIADVGGKGILDNYNKVNVFDDPTQKSLEARNNQVYQRAFGDAERLYKDTMNKYAAANYNQFGTLNATPAAYRTDMANLQFQRQLDDMAYNKAMNYDTIKDQELKRRYETLNMFNDLYQYGNTPYQQDIANWNIRNTNRDLSYQNQLVGQQNASNSGQGWGNLLGTTLGAVGGTFVAPGTGTMMGAQLGGQLGGLIGGNM